MKEGGAVTRWESVMLRRFLWSVCVGLVLLYLAAIVYAIVASTETKGYAPMDDAYIFVRYADNILAGYGLVWNPGESATYGATSLTYLASIVLARALSPLDSTHTVQIVSSLFSVLFVLVLTGVVRSLCRSKLLRHTPLALLVVLVTFLSQQPYLYHALSGMDTTLALVSISALIWAVFHMVKEQSITSVCLTAVLSYWCFLTRPDSGLYGLLFPVLALGLWNVSQRRKLLLQFVGAFFALLAVDVVWKYWLFGAALPLPYYVKSGVFYQGYAGHHRWNNIAYFFQMIEMATIPLALLLFCTRRRDCKLLVPLLAPVCLHVIYLHGVLQIMGNNARYYMLTLPFIMTASLLVLDRRCVEGEKQSSPDFFRLVWRGSLVLVLVVLPTLLVGEKIAGAYRKWVLEPLDHKHMLENPAPYSQVPPLGWKQSMQAFSKLLSTLPDHSLAAMSEVGYSGVVVPTVRIVDLAGLNDKHIAQDGFSVDYVLKRKPDLIWLPHADYTRQVRSFYQNPRFQKEYTIYPGAFDWGIAIRQNSPYATMLEDKLRELWRLYYGENSPLAYNRSSGPESSEQQIPGQ